MKSVVRVIRFALISGMAMMGPSLVAQAPAGTVNTNGTGSAGVHIESSAAYPDVVIKTGNAATSALRVFNAGNSELLRVSASGNVGIGTPSPTSRLMVKNDVAGMWGLVIEQRSTVSASGDVSDVASSSAAHITIPAGVTNSGSALGTSGLVYLQGGGTLASAYGLFGWANIASGTPSVANAYGVWTGVNRNTGTIQNGYGVYISDVGATNDYGVYQAGVDDSNYFGGDVRVGLVVPPGTAFTNKMTVNGHVTVAGNINVSGTITGASVIGATFQDLAEWVPATSNMEPGTVVILNGERVNEVMPSHRAYDTSVAGVVSANPGIILGVGSDAKEQIATTGRVKVRVDATREPVKIGDLLVTSDIGGTAMRSEPMEMNGRLFHQPGTIIGKALEPLTSGTGEILVLLSLQ
jgi:hypothetical protein